VRSPLAATTANPTGRPDWARSARVVQSHGPFLNAQGVSQWVDIIQLTVSLPFAFGSPAAPVAVFPVREIELVHQAPGNLALGPGTVWFLANLLSPALPGGNFAGFAITGGTLHCSTALSFQNGVYVIPAGATVTITVNPAPTPAPVNPGDPGVDGALAIFTPPANVTIRFQQSSAAFTAVADSSAQAYGVTVTLHWNHQTRVQASGVPVELLPVEHSRQGPARGCGQCAGRSAGSSTGPPPDSAHLAPHSSAVDLLRPAKLRAPGRSGGLATSTTPDRKSRVFSGPAVVARKNFQMVLGVNIGS